MSPPPWKIKVVEPISLKPEAELRFFLARFEPLAAFPEPTPEQPLQRPFAADRTHAVPR